ncbi:MAG: hypothetical protein ACP6IU_13740 [Candidatus Asgardarchaeia archaeon]
MSSEDKKIQIRKYGNVSERQISGFVNIIMNYYKKFNVHLKPMELLVFGTKEDLLLFKKREDEYLKADYGVRTSPISPNSAVTHYAWFDYPTITVCLEEYDKRDRDVAKAELIRAIVHSILHGSRRYYFIKMPHFFQRLKALSFLEKSVVDLGFYLFTIGVKGFEVSKYIAKKDPEDFPLFKRLYQYHLRIKDEEREAWKRNAGLFDIIFLLFLDNLKLLMEASPFAFDFHDDDLKKLIEENIELYPPVVRNDVKHLLWEYIQDLTGDAIDKIELITPRITWMTKKIEAYIKQHYFI